MASTERNAEKQALFRDVNERISAADRAFGRAGSLVLLCECGRDDCVQSVELTHEEYERVRTEPTDFVIVTGHQSPGVERVVGRTDRFTLVRNVGVAADIAYETDPRS